MAATRARPYRMAARAQAAARTRTHLLAAAWRHFATRPYDEVRLAGIAADAGVTVQTLHNRFVSKDRLLVEAYRWFGEREMRERDAVPPGAVREAVHVLFERYEEHGLAILRMIAQEERAPAIAALVEAGRAYHRDWVERTFEPLLRGLPAGRRARQLVAIVAATDLTVWRLLRRDLKLGRDEAERVVVEMVDPLGHAPATRREGVRVGHE